MDEFNARHNGFLVAHSRYVQIHSSAPFSDTLESLLRGLMPVGTDTLASFTTKAHSKLAVRLPHPVPYYALEWLRLEKYRLPREWVLDDWVRLVAHSRLSCYS